MMGADNTQGSPIDMAAQPQSRLATATPPQDKSAARARLADIIRARSFGYGEIKLASGRTSNFYFNMKPTMLDPEGAALIAELTLDALGEFDIDAIGGLEMGAVPIAGAIAQLSFLRGRPIPAFFVRKQPKDHGAKLAIEGLAPGETMKGKRVVVVEDVTTTGGSVREVLEVVRAAGAQPIGVAAIVNRSGQRNPFDAEGLPFWCLAEVEVQTWAPEACPLCADGAHGPAIKPGSRPGAASGRS